MAPRYQFCEVLSIFTAGHLFPLQSSLSLTEAMRTDFSSYAFEHIMMIGQVIFPLICTRHGRECRNWILCNMKCSPNPSPERGTDTLWEIAHVPHSPRPAVAAKTKPTRHR